jgi:hypothetical protein
MRRESANRLAISMVLFITMLMISTVIAGADISENEKPLPGEQISLTIHVGEYEIQDTEQGQKITVENFGHLLVPGKPMLPARNFLIALPPGARVQSVEVKGTGARQLPGTYQIIPTPPILPLVHPFHYPQITEELELEWQRNNQAVYSTDEAYPEERGKLESSGTLRKYSYASVSFYPFDYHPQSGRLIHYDAAQIIINYSLPSAGSSEAQRIEELKRDNVADEKASRLFVNYEQIKGSYRPTGPEPKAWQDTYDYLIITASHLLSAIDSSDFLDWKASLGYNTRIVLTTDADISGQPGGDLAEQIRNFLRSYYGAWGIEHVLLVGDHATVPMRYCFPDPTNHSFYPYDPYTYGGEVPTDYYYADLSNSDTASWDSDGDGFCGEYGQDSPDFMAEVYVGRIPTNDQARISYTLNKLVAFEQDTGLWKNQALHAGAILFFANQDFSGLPLIDGCRSLHSIETDLMGGWAISHYSEYAGLVASPYPWGVLTETAFANDWRNGQYGMVNWAGHGWTKGAYRTVWVWDDGDGVPETQNPTELSSYRFIGTETSDMDDDHPSIVFAISCNVGYPEPNPVGNLGIDLLTKPGFGSSVGVLSATRGAAVGVYWDSIPGGAESMCYEFNHYMIEGPSGPEKLGNALYDSKFYCNQNHGWDHYYEYKNMFDYNLYGDPALVREGTVPTFLCGDVNADKQVDVGDVIYLVNYLFVGGSAPECTPITSCGDANVDGEVDAGDAIYLVNYLFIGGSPPGC